MLFITTFNAFLNSVAANAGTSVIDTNNDANKLNAIANAKGLNISPTEPDTNTSGKKTIIVTSVDDIIGLNTSVVALIIKFSPLVVLLNLLSVDKYFQQLQSNRLSHVQSLLLMHLTLVYSMKHHSISEQ